MFRHRNKEQQFGHIMRKHSSGMVAQQRLGQHKSQSPLCMVYRGVSVQPKPKTSIGQQQCAATQEYLLVTCLKGCFLQMPSKLGMEKVLHTSCIIRKCPLKPVLFISIWASSPEIIPSDVQPMKTQV